MIACVKKLEVYLLGGKYSGACVDGSGFWYGPDELACWVYAAIGAGAIGCDCC